jgi:hypothetical protein
MGKQIAVVPTAIAIEAEDRGHAQLHITKLFAELQNSGKVAYATILDTGALFSGQSNDGQGEAPLQLPPLSRRLEDLADELKHRRVELRLEETLYDAAVAIINRLTSKTERAEQRGGK